MHLIPSTRLFNQVSWIKSTHRWSDNHSLFRSVFLTMVFSAFSVIFISTPESSAATEASLRQTYTFIKTNDDSNNATKLGSSLVNALIIVSVICVMTFVIVLFYKYKCFKCLSGYMILSSTMILGLLASNVSGVAVDRYQIPIDMPSFYFIMANFAIVGVLCIIAPQGAVPIYMNQFYLAATSVIVAWHFARFDPWTAWVLLIMLALYDLFAVLTPWGPLRALVNLMQRDDSPMIPGLLYEASISQPQRPRQQQVEPTHSPQPEQQDPTERQSTSESSGSPAEDLPLLSNDESPAQPSASSTNIATTATTTVSSEQPTADVSTFTGNTVPTTEHVDPSVFLGVPGRIPLALARLYKMRLQHDPQPYWISDRENPTSFTPLQLYTEVDVLFPDGGGRIVPTVSLDTPSATFYRRTYGREETRYTVIDRTGAHRRVVYVTNEGRVFEDFRAQNHAEDMKERTSIKLGLGDFIFYSILVSKAALYSYTAFAACIIAILSGLGLTLLLLAVHGKALPALPISIFMGVFFYLTTRFCLEPWVHEIFHAGVFF